MSKQFISAAANVNIGLQRKNNEDNLYFDGLYLTEETREQPLFVEYDCGDKRQFYAVFDGMGGEEYGELASLLAAETVHKYAFNLKTRPDLKMNEMLAYCIYEMNDAVCNARSGMGSDRIGTTLAMLSIEGTNADVYNVGDSRVYLLRDKSLRQVSEDHTSVAHAVKIGAMTPEEAKVSPHRNRLTQYVGIDPTEFKIVASHSSIKLKKKDVFLLCSDGVSDLLNETEMSNILSSYQRPADAAKQFVDLALQKGGKDNITAIVVRHR